MGVARLGDRRDDDAELALGFSADAIPYITIGVLVLIGVVLTVSPVVYQTVEKIQFFMVGLIIIFVVYALLFLLGGDGYAALGRGFVEVDKIPDGIETIGAATLLGAIAFAGSRRRAQPGPVQLGSGQGAGDGGRLPKIVSPFTGEEVAAPTTGYFFKRDEENMRRWNGWWKVANREQFVTFFVIGAISLFVFMTLTLVTVGTGGRSKELRLHRGPG